MIVFDALSIGYDPVAPSRPEPLAPGHFSGHFGVEKWYFDKNMIKTNPLCVLESQHTI